MATEIGDRPNIHILHADLTDHASLKQAAADTAPIVGDRGIDYLIANGAFPSTFDAFHPIGVLYVFVHASRLSPFWPHSDTYDRGDQVQELEETGLKSWQTNVIGNIHFINLFMPLVLKGRVKKVFAISSGHADLDFINDLDVEVSFMYAATKAALNVVVAKFSAQYKKQGVLFISMSPGVVDVGHYNNGSYG